MAARSSARSSRSSDGSPSNARAASAKRPASKWSWNGRAAHPAVRAGTTRASKNRRGIVMARPSSRAGVGERGRPDLRARQEHGEGASAVHPIANPDRAAVRVDDLAADGEPEPDAAPGDLAARFRLVKPLEDGLFLIVGHAGPIVRDLDAGDA